MGYSELKSAPKALTTGDQIANGAIELRHLAPSLFSEIQKQGLHSHTGSGSRKVKITDLGGAFGSGGFYMYDTSGTRYHVTISGGAFVLTQG